MRPGVHGDDRLQSQLYAVALVALAAVLIAVAAATVALSVRQTLRPAVDFRVGQDLGRGISCVVLDNSVQGKVTLACAQGGKR